MKNIQSIILLLLLASAVGSGLRAQTTNAAPLATVTNVPPPTPPIVHKIVIPAAVVAQLDPTAPSGKRGFVSPGVIAADGTLTVTVTYK